MTDISAASGSRLVTPEETRSGYKGFGDDIRIGVEHERQIYNLATLAPITVAENAKLEATAVSLGSPISQEASAQTVEVKTDAFRHGDLQKLFAQLASRNTALECAARENGFAASDLPILPQARFPKLLEQVHPRERSQIFLDHFLNHDRRSVARYFTTFSGTQVSLSYRDDRHGFDTFRRAVYLAPLLTALTSTLPPFRSSDNGQWRQVKSNQSLVGRVQPGGIGNAVSQGFWKSAGADDFFSRYDRGIWDTPLFCAYDGKGTLNGIADKADIKSLSALPRAFHSAANYALASSIQWQLVSLSSLPGENDIPRRRVEIRYLDTLPQPLARGVISLFSAIANDEKLAARLDRVLEKAGFSSASPRISESLWQQSLRDTSARHANPWNACFGLGSIGDAANALLPILEDVAGTQALRSIIASRATPAQALRARIPDVASLNSALRSGRALHV